MKASPNGLTVPRLAAVVLAAVMALSGCGGDNESADETVAPASETPEQSEALDTDVPDLCSLFTPEDFQALTGEKAGEPEVDEAMGALRGTCTTSAETGLPLVLIAAYNESDRQSTLDTVSYTHLDVYKRQPVRRPPTWSQPGTSSRGSSCRSPRKCRGLCLADPTL